MRILYQPINDIFIREGNCRSTSLLDIHQDFLDYLVRENMILVVSYQELWIHGEYINKALYALWQKLIGILDVFKSIRKHLPLLYELWYLASVYVNYVSRVVHYVVSENGSNVVRNLGKYIPYRLLSLVLPLLVLNVVSQKGSELALVRKGEICLV